MVIMCVLVIVYIISNVSILKWKRTRGELTILPNDILKRFA